MSPSKKVHQGIPDDYAGKAQGVALSIGCAGSSVAALAREFPEVHTADFTREAFAASAAQASQFTNVFTHAVRSGAELGCFDPGTFAWVEAGGASPEWVRPAAKLLARDGYLHMRMPGGVSVQDLRDLASQLDLQSLVCEVKAGEVEFLWRKRDAGWRDDLETLARISTIAMLRITNAWRALPVVHSRGRFAAVAIWMQGLPDEADLFDIEVLIGSSAGKAVAIGPAGAKDIRKVIAWLPELEQTGLLPVELRWMGERMGKPGVLRVMPPPPEAPRLMSLAAAEDGTVRAVVEDLPNPDLFGALVEGQPAWGYDNYCIDPQAQRYEVRFRLPDGVGAGDRWVTVRLGRRELPPVLLKVA